MSRIPPARLVDKPLPLRSFSSSSSPTKLDPQDSFNSMKTSYHSEDEINIVHNTASYHESNATYVKWGISWHPPTLMAVYGLGGIGVAIGHHFYFASLHGTLAGSPSRQQWSTAIGTGVSFLVVTLLRAASCIAYSQYVWNIVRRRPYKLSTLDKMFALTTDPIGFFGWEMFKYAKVALILALCCW